MNPDGLIRVAEYLIGAGSSEPSAESEFLRRSISTSYYAAFTGLCLEVGRVYSPEVALTAQRLVSHTQAREVCDKLTQPESKLQWLRGKPECNTCLRSFSQDFSYLQLRRMRADYDPLYTVRQRDADQALRKAKSALASLETARNDCPEQLQTLCIVSITRPEVLSRLKEHT